MRPCALTYLGRPGTEGDRERKAGEGVCFFLYVSGRMWSWIVKENHNRLELQKLVHERKKPSQVQALCLESISVTVCL